MPSVLAIFTLLCFSGHGTAAMPQDISTTTNDGQDTTNAPPLPLFSEEGCPIQYREVKVTEFEDHVETQCVLKNRSVL